MHRFHWFTVVGGTKQWKEYSRDEKIDFIIYLLEQCELVDRNRRLQAMRAILYLIQGKLPYYTHKLTWYSIIQVCFINARTSMNTWSMQKKTFFYFIRVMVCIYLLIYSTWN